MTGQRPGTGFVQPGSGAACRPSPDGCTDCGAVSLTDGGAGLLTDGGAGLLIVAALGDG
ncbi:hypothetical protein HQ303_00940 [Rhodococcus sp. BP-110]|nr:hypothetical protein [Rhodococcus sp. BP-110]